MPSCRFGKLLATETVGMDAFSCGLDLLIIVLPLHEFLLPRMGPQKGDYLQVTAIQTQYRPSILAAVRPIFNFLTHRASTHKTSVT